MIENFKWRDVLDIYNGRNQKKVISENGKYPIYGSGGIMGYASDFICPEGTTIIGRKGSINNPIYVDSPFWNVDTAFGLVPKKVLDSKYLYYFCLKYDFLKHNKTVTIPSLTKSDLLEIKIDLPPLTTQKAIAEKLDKADALRKKDQELLAQYDELAQAIFIDMFGDPVKNEKGWEISQYGSEFKISSGGTPRTNNSNYWEGGAISWIGSNMCQNKVIYQNDGKHITEEGLKNSSARVFPVDTVLVALVGATIGKVALLKFETSTNQNIAGIEINGSFNSLFVFHSLMNSYNVFMELGNGGFKMANLSFIRNLELISPALELQNQFAEKIQNIEAQKALVKQQAQQSEDLFQALLQESFNF